MGKMNSELEQLLSRMEQEQKKEPSSGGWYSKVGDCVFFFNEPDTDYFAERIDGRLTIYRALEDRHRIIGVQVKGIRTLPGHDIIQVHVMQTGRLELVTLLLGSLIQSRSESTGESPEFTSKRENSYLDLAREMGGCAIDATELLQV